MRWLRRSMRRQTIALACLLLVVCFVLGADYYRSVAVLRTNKKAGVADGKTSMENRQSTQQLRRENDLNLAMNGGDTCGSATAISALPYNDSGTTVGMTDDYDLPVAFTAPTVTGCPSCNATGGGPAEAAPRGGVYLGTGTAPDSAYSITFSSSNNSIDVSVTPTGSEDLALIVYTDVCSSLLSDAIVVDDDGAGGIAEHVVISNMPAGTYNIVVDGYSTGGTPPGPSGPYTLAVTGTGTIVGGPTPTATKTPTNTPTPAETPSVAGTITYGNPVSPATKFISNATVTATGGTIFSTTTGAPSPGPNPGGYTLTGFGSGNYVVSVTKTTGQNGISGGDAARVAQHAVGLIPMPSDGQRIAADVTNNNSITGGDAAQIARFAVGLGAGTAITNQWRFFVPDPGFPTFPVGASPTTRSYTDPIGVNAAQEFIGILMGEVTGNWTPGPLRPAFTDNGQETTADESGGETGNIITVDIPKFAALPNSDFIVPVSVQGIADKEVISYEFDLCYDPSVIQPQENPVDVAGTVSRGLLVVTNAQTPGLLRVVMYGAMPIDENGLLLNLRFTTVGTLGSVSPLTFGRIMFNEGESRIVSTDGHVEVLAKSD